MFYINVQTLDYDDYPMGSPTQIGPFASEGAAETFLENSSHFYKQLIFGDYSEWKCRRFGRHSVSVRPVTYGLVSPTAWA